MRTGQIAFVCDHCGRMATVNYKDNEFNGIQILSAEPPKGWSVKYFFSVSGDLLCQDCIDGYQRIVDEAIKKRNAYIHGDEATTFNALCGITALSHDGFDQEFNTYMPMSD